MQFVTERAVPGVLGVRRRLGPAGVVGGQSGDDMFANAVCVVLRGEISCAG